MSHRVLFYTKRGCHLCDEARAMLEEIAAESEFDLNEVDILGDTTLFEQYRHRIPVLIIDDRKTLEGRIDPDELASALH